MMNMMNKNNCKALNNAELNQVNGGGFLGLNWEKPKDWKPPMYDLFTHPIIVDTAKELLFGK